ncbi:MAG: FtsQ-type POTRA domain-containing protein [Pyrinomonadaceae bacterium]|nr:FtsQ-type POTRA domain-containing protein [Pyrinomonadaceae bacterium]
MATRKRNIKKTTTLNRATPKTKRRRTAISSRKTKNTGNVLNFLVPLAFILAILAGLGFLAYKGYQTVTASSFFDVKRVEVRGNSRVSEDDIKKIVRQRTEQQGVWNAELEQIKADVEKMSFVKSAVVSRILPDGILVRLEERIPRAVARLKDGDFWVDDDAVIIATVGKNEKPSPLLRGWNEEKSEKAQKENQERVKNFVKIQNDLQSLGIGKRVTTLNLSDLQDAQAVVEDSGASVSIYLGKEDFGKRLQQALTVIEGKGNSIESLKSYDGRVIATYRNNQSGQ